MLGVEEYIRDHYSKSTFVRVFEDPDLDMDFFPPYAYDGLVYLNFNFDLIEDKLANSSLSPSDRHYYIDFIFAYANALMELFDAKSHSEVEARILETTSKDERDAFMQVNGLCHNFLSDRSS